MSAAPNRPSRRSAKGQAMAIFALVSVLLFVVAGLAVDAGTSYLTSNKIERAAAAAALAGVAYLPGDIPDAQNAALVEAARDGFPNAGTATRASGNPASPCVVTSEPATNELKVTISASVVDDLPAHRRLRHRTRSCAPRRRSTSRRSRSASRARSRDRPWTRAATACPTTARSPSSGLGSGGKTTTSSARRAGATPAPKVIRSRRRPRRATTAAARAGGDSCSASSAPDFHEISPEAGTEPPDATLNYPGGSNYLITIPAGQSADVQVYNPAFAPDTCGRGNDRRATATTRTTRASRARGAPQHRVLRDGVHALPGLDAVLAHSATSR